MSFLGRVTRFASPSKAEGYYTVNIESYEFDRVHVLEKKEKISQDEIEISGDWGKIDIVSPQPKCVNDICANSAPEEVDETHFLSPDNGGCEQICNFMHNYVSVSCACDFQYQLRSDQKTCVKKWHDFLDGESNPEKFQHECDFEDESTWDCSTGNQCIKLSQVCDRIKNCEGPC